MRLLLLSRLRHWPTVLLPKLLLLLLHFLLLVLWWMSLLLLLLLSLLLLPPSDRLRRLLGIHRLSVEVVRICKNTFSVRGKFYLQTFQKLY